MDPVVHGRLSQAEELAHEDLDGISLEIDQEEEQLLLGGMKCPPAPAASGPSAGSTCCGPIRGMEPLIRASEGG